MSDHEKAICIGGPLNGKRVEVQGIYLHYPIPRDPPVYVPETDDTKAYVDHFATGTYRLARRPSGQWVYVHDG